jgi:protein SCO1/2/putative membrane protein
MGRTEMSTRPRSRDACRIILLTAALTLGLVTVPGRAAIEDLDLPLPDFSLIDQDGRTVTRSGLAGKVWIVSFFFTRCATVCPQVTATMAQLQKDLSGREGVVLVSLTVDPEHDTPAVLKQYAAAHGAESKRWWFVTGEEAEVYRLIQTGFALAVAQNQGAGRTPGNEVTHSTRLAVVDRLGHVRAYFEGRYQDQQGRPIHELAALERRVKAVLREGSALTGEDLPSVNAALNATGALLLMLGFAAIRRRRIRLHACCMVTALAVSMLFLASYLYYHFVVKNGRPTPFTGEGWVRPVYFTILVSHTLLAVAVAPLALVTVTLGLRGRIQRHVRIARWTLPLWLYVSVTGVVVYWMLYRLYPAG